MRLAFFLLTLAKPTKPVPRKSMVAGSGKGALSSLTIATVPTEKVIELATPAIQTIIKPTVNPANNVFFICISHLISLY